MDVMSQCISTWALAFQFLLFVSPALAGKTLGDHFVPCWCLLSVVVCCLLWKQVNIWLYFPHALVDFNQSWVIDAIWKPAFVDKIWGHLSRSKVIWGQVVREDENIKVASFEKLKSDWNQLDLWIKYGTFCMFMWSKVIYHGQRSSEVKL